MHKRYLVTGTRQYRCHKPGTEFEAQLDPDAERRAIERGTIRVLEVSRPSLKAVSYALPNDQAPKVEAVKPSLKIGSYRLPNDQPSKAVGEPNRDALSGSRTH